jgi:anaerobic selenocysteine-containing dehydrogenase
MKKIATISTICRMCDHGCGIEVGVAEGQPVSLKGTWQHPYNKGWLCAKGRAALDFFHHPHGLTTPLIKKEGKFVPVDWNQALDIAAKTRLEFLPETVWSTIVSGCRRCVCWLF